LRQGEARLSVPVWYEGIRRDDQASATANRAAEVGDLRRRLVSVLGIKVVAAFTAVGTVALAVAVTKVGVKIVKLITPRRPADHFERFDLRSPLHRFASRTTRRP
jgi:hypothetical protein